MFNSNSDFSKFYLIKFVNFYYSRKFAAIFQALFDNHLSFKKKLNKYIQYKNKSVKFVSNDNYKI